MHQCITVGLLFAIALAATVQAADFGGADEAARIVLRNDRLTLALGKAEKGAIVSLTDNATGVEFIAPQAAPRVFELTFSEKGKPTADRITLSSREAGSVKTRLENLPGRSVATLDYDGLGGKAIRVSCTATVTEADPLVRWRLSATFPDSLVLEEVQFPFLVLRSPLGDDAKDDAAVIGRTKGGVIREPGKLKVGAGVYARQPGTLAAQFACYYAPRAGLYTAAYDSKGCPKDCVMRRTKEGIEVFWNPHYFTSEPLALDFDLVLTTFASADPAAPADWRDAADIYKSWALGQPWCARPYAQRDDIPEWMKAGPAMVRFSRGWLAKPELIEKWLKDYWTKYFTGPPLITAYWGWEKVGSWVTPDYFPVFPSDEEFTRLVALSRKMGCHVFLWPSGYHWTLMYQKRPDGSFLWDDRKRFDEIAAPHAVHERDGKVYDKPRSWLMGGNTSCLCPGDPWTIPWWNKEIALHIAQRGGEIIQVDQVVGGGYPFCYSREHGHPPGPGLWMTEAFERHLRTIFAECRQVERDFVVGFEEPNERFNHLVGIQDYRDCETPNEPASVFNYLYHEFLPTFQSNPHAGDTVMMAYCLVNGQIPHMVPSMRMGPGPALYNGDFEEWSAGTDAGAPHAVGWDKVAGWKGVMYNGKAYRDDGEKHGGQSSLRLENPNEADIVQVSQNVSVGDGIEVGRKYRLSAWTKVDHLARRGGIGLGAQKSDETWASLGTVPISPSGTAWTRTSAEFTPPESSVFLRIMIHADGKAKLWVDDLVLEELRPDGTAAPAMRPETPADHKLMKQWVDLFHGEGRPYLLFGRMLHPPKLETGTITWKGKPLPAIFHNAFRAPDGSEAVILANPTRQRQVGKMIWKGKEMRVELDGEEVRLVRSH